MLEVRHRLKLPCPTSPTPFVSRYSLFYCLKEGSASRCISYKFFASAEYIFFIFLTLHQYLSWL